jgi:hypothetical protein
MVKENNESGFPQRQKLCSSISKDGKNHKTLLIIFLQRKAMTDDKMLFIFYNKLII